MMGTNWTEMAFRTVCCQGVMSVDQETSWTGRSEVASIAEPLLHKISQ